MVTTHYQLGPSMKRLKEHRKRNRNAAAAPSFPVLSPPPKVVATSAVSIDRIMVQTKTPTDIITFLGTLSM